MRASTISLGLLTAFVLFSPAKIVRADDLLDEVKRARKVAADKLDAELRSALTEADKLAKTNRKEAVDLLEARKATLSVDRNMTEDRKKEWLNYLESRIRGLRAEAASGFTPAQREDLYRRVAERNREVEQRNNELKAYHNQVGEWMRQGKYKEVEKYNEQMRQKYPTNPAFGATRSIGRAADYLSELRAIRDEKSDRYQKNMLNLIRASIPIDESQPVSFPDNWKELTKRRTKSNLTEKEQALIKALNTPVTLEVKGQPIEPVLQELERRYKITIDIDKIGLEQATLNSESPVSVNVKGQTLRSTLKKLLGDVGLTFSIRNEGLRVTTPQRAADDMVVRAYYVGDLVSVANMNFDPFGYNQLQMVQSVGSLINMIQGIDPTSWETGGGRGNVIFEPRTMSIIIKQSAEMQFKMQGWLK